jgi:hypothetical protein
VSNGDVIVCEGQVWLMPDGHRARVIPGGHHGLWLCEIDEPTGLILGMFKAFTDEDLRLGTLLGGPRDVCGLEARSAGMLRAMADGVSRTGRENW